MEVVIFYYENIMLFKALVILMFINRLIYCFADYYDLIYLDNVQQRSADKESKGNWN